AAAAGLRDEYWLFQDGREPQHLGSDLAGVFPKNVCLLVFVRFGGAAEFHGARTELALSSRREDGGSQAMARCSKAGVVIQTRGGVGDGEGEPRRGSQQTGDAVNRQQGSLDLQRIAELGGLLFVGSGHVHSTFEALFFARAQVARDALAFVNCRLLIELVLRASGCGGLVGSHAQASILRHLRGDDPVGPIDDFVSFAKGCLKSGIVKEDLWMLRLPHSRKVSVPSKGASKNAAKTRVAGGTASDVRGWREAATAEQARRERVEGVNVLFGRGSQAGVPGSSRSDVGRQGDSSIDQHGAVGGGGGGGCAAASGGSCAGCENRGFRQANRSRRLGGVAGNAKRMRPGLRVDGESTSGVPVGGAGVGSSSSAAPGVPLATSVPRGPAHVTKLRRKLCSLRLSEEIVDAVLGAMQARFGEGLAWEYAESQWLVSWPRWEVFAEEVQIELRSWEVGFAVIHVAPLVSNMIFALFRFAIQQARVGVELSDDAKLEELEA
ncbi:MAG: hypothetical protein GY747_00370, partial [Planctomycetes bacterium]|nr:hypothetical protein [Planctomycetota bacterium]